MTKGEQTKQFIIEKAAPIFNVKGIEATALSDIMQATKLSKGTLYVHFDNKEVLALAAIDYNMEMLGKKVFSKLAIQKDIKGKLFAFIDVLTDVVNPPVIGGCPMINFGMEADDTNSVIKKKIHDRIEYSQQLLANLIKEGIQNGEFKESWNYKEFATIMFAMLEGGIVISRVAGNNNKVKLISKVIKKMISEQQR